MQALHKWRDVLLLLPALILVLLPIADIFLAFHFLFESTLELNQEWFPRFYWLTFIGLHLIFPVLYGLWLYGILTTAIAPSRYKVWLLPAAQTLLVVYLQHKGFAWVTGYTWILLLLHTGILLYHRWYVQPQGQPFVNHVLFRRSFVCLTYIILCLSLPKFHPFSKYTMFSSFPDKADLFLLRDTKGNLVPLAEYTSLSSNSISELKSMLCRKYDLDEDHIEKHKDVLGPGLMKYVFLGLKKPLPYDSLSLYRVSFQLKQNQLIKSEERYYTCKVE